MDQPRTSGGTVAVIGGSGYIGRVLVRRLADAGRSVRVIDTRGGFRAESVEGVRGDVRDERSLRSALEGVEVVYNLASARGTESLPWETYEALNIEGARNVCAAVEHCGISRLVFTSSASVYGYGDGPDEESVCRPSGHYGISKLRAEEIYRGWLEGGAERSLAIVRPTVVFGPGADGYGNRLFRLVSHPDFVLVGDGGQRKSLAYVENVAAFLAFVGELPGRAQLFNYTDLPVLRLEAIVRLVREALELEPARRRSRSVATIRAAAATLSRRFGRPAVVGLHELGRVSLERHFDASRAHASGFRQPVDLVEALASTARVEGALSRLVQKSRT